MLEHRRGARIHQTTGRESQCQAELKPKLGRAQDGRTAPPFSLPLKGDLRTRVAESANVIAVVAVLRESSDSALA